MEIFVTKADLGRIWGCSAPTVSKYCAQLGADAFRGQLVNLEQALELKPVMIDEADFENVLQADAVAARELGLYALYAASDGDRARAAAHAARSRPNGKIVQGAPEVAPAAEAGQTMSDVRSQLAQAQLELQSARVEQQKLKNAQLDGSLIYREDVDKALTKLGTDCRTILERVPAKVAAFVPVEDRAACVEQIDSLVRKVLAAIAAAAEAI